MNSCHWLETCYPWIESLDGDYLCVNCWSPHLLIRLRLTLVPASVQHRMLMSGPCHTCWHRAMNSGLRCSIPDHHIADVDVPLCNFDVCFKAEATSKSGASGTS